MKLPEPVAGFRQNEGWGGLWEQVIPEAMHKPDITRMYSETQVRELLAQADKQMVGKYEPVLKQALDALYWTTPIGGKPVKQTQDAMDAIRKVLA